MELQDINRPKSEIMIASMIISFYIISNTKRYQHLQKDGLYIQIVAYTIINVISNIILYLYLLKWMHLCDRSTFNPVMMLEYQQ